MKRIIAAFLTIGAFPATASAQELTVYSSLPLSGASRVQTKAVNDGARQALQEAGGQAAGKPVRLRTLNSATKKAGSWTPERTARNAVAATQDPSTVAYIGEFNSGASKVSIPILNEAGIPQVSPSNTYNGLTTSGPGTEKGEPDKWYPTGRRSYFRIVPNDHVQAAALATVMRDRGCTKVGLVHDGEVYGKGMNADVAATLARLGVPVVTSRKITRRAPAAVRRAGADCMAYTGITANGAVRLFRSSALRKLRLFGSDGVAETGFVGRLPRSVDRRTTIMVATLDYGNGRDPYWALGYEAMKLILDGLNTSGGTRAGLLGWLPTVQNRQSILGTYGFDSGGDTTLRRYGVYGVRGSSLVYQGEVTAG